MRKASMDNSLVKALLYGAPGTTKTRTAASAVYVDDMWPVLMLESAANPLSIRDYSEQPTIITMETMKDYNLPFDWLAHGQPEKHDFVTACNKADIDILHHDGPYRTVDVDGLTETQRFAFRAVVPGRDANVGDVPTTTERQHFNSVLAMMVNWAYKFVKLPMHVILTSLEVEKDNGSGVLYRRPLLWGQSQAEVSSYVYLVMRLTAAEYMDTRTKAVVATDLTEVNASQNIGFVKQSGSFYAKDQYGMCDENGQLMKYMFDPSMKKIWEAIHA